jgi:hypothetical protein
VWLVAQSQAAWRAIPSSLSKRLSFVPSTMTYDTKESEGALISTTQQAFKKPMPGPWRLRLVLSIKSLLNAQKFLQRITKHFTHWLLTISFDCTVLYYYQVSTQKTLLTTDGFPTHLFSFDNLHLLKRSSTRTRSS